MYTIEVVDDNGCSTSKNVDLFSEVELSRMVLLSGDNQTAILGVPLAEPFEIQLFDERGVPMETDFSTEPVWIQAPFTSGGFYEWIPPNDPWWQNEDWHWRKINTYPGSTLDIVLFNTNVEPGIVRTYWQPSRDNELSKQEFMVSYEGDTLAITVDYDPNFLFFEANVDGASWEPTDFQFSSQSNSITASNEDPNSEISWFNITLESPLGEIGIDYDIEEGTYKIKTDAADSWDNAIIHSSLFQPSSPIGAAIGGGLDDLGISIYDETSLTITKSHPQYFEGRFELFFRERVTNTEPLEYQDKIVSGSFRLPKEYYLPPYD